MGSDSLVRFAHPSFEGRIGMARRDVTPWTDNFREAEWGTENLRPLYATAFAFLPDDAPPFILVGIDLGWWGSAKEEEDLRKALCAATSVAEDRFLLHAAQWFPGSLTPRETEDHAEREAIDAFLEHVLTAISEAVTQAIDTAELASLAWTAVRCDLAADLNRGNPFGESAVWGFGPTFPPTDVVLVGRVTTESQGHVATLVNYACSSRCEGPPPAARPGYIHFMRATVERATAGMCLFLQGSGGDLSPRGDALRDEDFVEQNGRQLGHVVLSALWGMLPHSQSLEWSFAGESHARGRMVEYQLPKATAVAIRHVELVINGQTASVPVHALRLGSTIFVGIAAEAPSDLQIGLRRRFPNQSLVVMNDLNGHVGRIESAVVLESLIEPCAVVVKEVLGR